MLLMQKRATSPEGNVLSERDEKKERRKDRKKRN
jgi:hypothetical protein